ncbi:C13 family peptidase [Sphingomonas hylomeconis]|uniref:C13 family peptidase n=1 Tax=Sphingomonas hylomeconis TaxID=1395958 RepID=A0ABV7SZZ3_9SPHN|nr:C13 family peptidase [Sphingomonas hylomeconis]
MSNRSGRVAGVVKWLAVAALALTAGASAQYQAPQHTQPAPFMAALPPEVSAYLADLGLSSERDRDAAWTLAEHRRVDRALAALQPQRTGIVDAYVMAIALDSDPVFGREAREAGRVLSRRYDAAGRTIVLAGTDGSAASSLPRGSPDTLALALARIAELMDPKEDVLVLYTTSHGAPIGIVYNDADQGFGMISPQRLWAMLGKLGIERRMVLISACYSGVFVPLLASEDSVVITASSADRTSFGCQADNDWTFFGDALINHALRKAQPIGAAGTEAVGLIGAWEAQGKLTPSQPQVSIGSRTGAWLAALDARGPKATSMPVGRPAVSMLDGK